jgi:hypothetical protein
VGIPSSFPEPCRILEKTSIYPKWNVVVHLILWSIWSSPFLLEVSSDGHQLKRTLTAANLIALGIGAIIGAGLFVDNEIGAASATGVGEEVVRICGSHTVVEMMRHGLSPEEACEEAGISLPEKIKGYQYI